MNATEVNIEHCRSCQAPIYWVTHADGEKRAPIEVAPAPGGNILLNRKAGTYRVVSAKERAQFAGQLHYNHFVHCPQAKHWSARRGYPPVPRRPRPRHRLGARRRRRSVGRVS